MGGRFEGESGADGAEKLFAVEGFGEDGEGWRGEAAGVGDLGAVTTMMGSWGYAAEVRRWSSQPSMPGIWRSVRRQSTVACWKRSRASSLVAKTRESMPAESKRHCRASRMRGSSSTATRRGREGG